MRRTRFYNIYYVDLYSTVSVGEAVQARGAGGCTRLKYRDKMGKTRSREVERIKVCFAPISRTTTVCRQKTGNRHDDNDEKRDQDKEMANSI